MIRAVLLGNSTTDWEDIDYGYADEEEVRKEVEFEYSGAYIRSYKGYKGIKKIC